MNIRNWAASVLLLASVLGCSDKPTSSLNQTPGNDTDEFGGFTIATESPAFGDAQIALSGEGETEFNDVFASSPDVAALHRDRMAGRYHLRVVWGKLRYDSSVTTLTDWTGSLTISRGAELVRRVIRFERGQDFIKPRTNRTLIEWVSMTSVHHDGIAVDLLIPRVRPRLDTTLVVDSLGDTSRVIDTIPPDPVTVDFQTGPYSRTLTLDEIAALDTVIWLADSNAIAFHGLRVGPQVCPRGFLTGRWGHNDSGRGVFHGAWMSSEGRVVGHFRGHFGMNEQGERVLMGKWIGANGRFEGFVRGTWGPHDDPNSGRVGGEFHAKVLGADGVEIGDLRGVYRENRELAKGFLGGRWRLHCNGGLPDGNGRGNQEGFR